MTHHLTISRGNVAGFPYAGELRFSDGSTLTFVAENRARLIAQVQARIQLERDREEVLPEELTLDEFGEIVREPSEWSTRV